MLDKIKLEIEGIKQLSTQIYISAHKQLREIVKTDAWQEKVRIQEFSHFPTIKDYREIDFLPCGYGGEPLFYKNGEPIVGLCLEGSFYMKSVTAKGEKFYISTYQALIIASTFISYCETRAQTKA